MSEKFSFVVNGKTIVTTEDVNLLDFLRDDLGLISVKDGCKEGACGTCTILVDGKAMKSCIFTTKKVAGKEITTIEGFTMWILYTRNGSCGKSTFHENIRPYK